MYRIYVRLYFRLCFKNASVFLRRFMYCGDASLPAVLSSIRGVLLLIQISHLIARQRRPKRLLHESRNRTVQVLDYLTKKKKKREYLGGARDYEYTNQFLCVLKDTEITTIIFIHVNTVKETV